jgi:hypothetical protein
MISAFRREKIEFAYPTHLNYEIRREDPYVQRT